MAHLMAALAGGAGGGFSLFGIAAAVVVATAGLALELSRRRR